VGAGPDGHRFADGRAGHESLAWQWIFWINVPIGLASIPLVLSRMKEGHGPSLDLRGLALVSAGAQNSVAGAVPALETT
jgi:MFS family permease